MRMDVVRLHNLVTVNKLDLELLGKVRPGAYHSLKVDWKHSILQIVVQPGLNLSVNSCRRSLNPDSLLVSLEILDVKAHNIANVLSQFKRVDS